MVRRRSRRRKKAVVCGDPNDPHGLFVWMQRYLSSLAVRNYSPITIEQRTLYLSLFVTWSHGRGLGRPGEISKPILESYQRHLYHLRQKRNGKPLTFRSQYTRLVAVRNWFKWLTRQNVLLANPASELLLPKLERRLPTVMTVANVEQVLALADTTEPLGLRDRAMMEVLYSTGVRRMELIGLSVWDLNLDSGTLLVRQGKGRRDRVVPIGERAIAWVTRYQRDARPKLLVPPDEGSLFVAQLGGALSKNHVTRLIRRYILAAEIGKSGSCHLFRHSMATSMLEGGADIRFIQQLLGHRDLSSTQLYTQVSIKQLKRVHQMTHPTAALAPTGAAMAMALEDGDPDDANRDEHANRSDPDDADRDVPADRSDPTKADRDEQAAELLSDLAGEEQAGDSETALGQDRF